MKILQKVEECSESYGCSFVPTMGALHKGHITLIEAALKTDRPCVVSIFVNPKQFGPKEDYSKYPRMPDSDLAICRQLGVSAVFMPDEKIMYPPEFKTVVSIPTLSNCLCGLSRKGHFDGVATVVARLFGIVKPAEAFFGWKDAQQLIIIKRMVDDLALGIKIHGIETVREADGLALSSRNLYLSDAERKTAPNLYKGLKLGEAAAQNSTAGVVIETARQYIESSGLMIDYVDLRRISNLSAVDYQKKLDAKEQYLLASAVFCGSVRLIDNVKIF